MILFYFRFDHFELPYPLPPPHPPPHIDDFPDFDHLKLPLPHNLEFLTENIASISLYSGWLLSRSLHADQEQCVVHWACRNSSFRLGRCPADIANGCLKYIVVSSINEGIKPPFNKIQTMFAQKKLTFQTQPTEHG